MTQRDSDQPQGIGIVEGRLAGPADERFARARAIGFDAVELSFSGQDYESLPLWTASGAVRVHRLAAEAGVDIPSTCATYFNRYAFASPDEAERERCVEVLHRIIDTSAVAGLRTILLPFFGNGELKSAAEEELAATMVARCAAQARAAGIRLGIEATLPAQRLRAMVEIAGQDAPGTVGVYYDVGNVCAAGYDQEADLQVLADLLVGIHIKDRTRADQPVPLGEGDVDFGAVARGLRAAAYDGYLVLETPGPPPGAGASDATNAAYLAFTRRLVQSAA